MKNIDKKTHTNTMLIYITNPTQQRVLTAFMSICFFAGASFMAASKTHPEATAFMVGIGLVLLSIFLLIRLNKTVWCFNKESEDLMISTKSLIFKQYNIKKYPLNDIKEIYWKKERVYKASQYDYSKTYNYFCYIRLKNTIEQLCISTSKEPVLKITEELKDFLEKV
ncbi:MAG: hypothetical protein AB7V50_10695 [Vampirovibrionia bacterium]